jgi:hypothetical protein
MRKTAYHKNKKVQLEFIFWLQFFYVVNDKIVFCPAD